MRTSGAAAALPKASCLTCLPTLFFLLNAWIFLSPCEGKKVAVIGGGISGTFVTKYLVDYDKDCLLDSIVIFDPLPIGEVTPVNAAPEDEWQGSRVSSMAMEDGRIVELGASVAHEAFYLVVDMINGDHTLEMGRPFHTGLSEEHPDEKLRKGLGIYEGESIWTLMTDGSSLNDKLKILLRYNLDLWRVDSAMREAKTAFSHIHRLLKSDHASTFFDSPDDMWNAVGLLKPIHNSFAAVLDALGIYDYIPWWRSFLPYQGSLRAELLTAINLVNYNQGVSQVNGLVGLASFSSSTGSLFSVVGGNCKIMQSALQQAQNQSKRVCSSKTEDVVKHIKERVTIVIGRQEAGFHLFAGNNDLGYFDAVIVACPLQQARINFLVQSAFDETVLQNMPLGGKIDPDEMETDDGFSLLADPLPSHASWPYTQVVTTVVSNASIQYSYFGITSEEDLPRSIVMTEKGKTKENNITAISQLTGDGVYKVFSNDRLDGQTLQNLFGSEYQPQYVKRWGGKHGGATPDFRGAGKTTNYLLYDAASGISGHTSSGPLYYVNAIESALTCMEASAIGAKSVAKLLAKRFGLLTPVEASSLAGDEF